MAEERHIPDEELLHLAMTILTSEHYSTELVRSEDEYPLLLAENPFFVLLLAATSTIEELSFAESVASNYLVQRLTAAEIGAKRWDANVVVLTSQQLGRDTPNTRTLFDINYDTRGVRRLARVGVAPTPAGLREALRPFVPPIDYVALTEEDPLEHLADALEMAGVDRRLCQRAIDIFREGGDLSNVI